MATPSTKLSGSLAATTATASASATAAAATATATSAPKQSVAGADVKHSRESSVIKHIAAIILKAGNNEAAQEKSADEIRRIILENSPINLNQPIDNETRIDIETGKELPPAAPELTLTDLAIFINNIAATATLASLGARLRTSHPADPFMQVLELEERLHGVRIKMKDIEIAAMKAQSTVATASKTAAGSAGALATAAQITDVKSTSELEKICKILKAANTDAEKVMAALEINGILKGAAIKLDLNKPLPDGSYLLDIAFEKRNAKAQVVLRFFGADPTPKFRMYVAMNPGVKAAMEAIEEMVKAKRQEAGKERDLTRSTIAQSQDDLKSFDERGKAARIDLMNKFKTECRGLLDLNKKYIGEWQEIYGGYCNDLNVAVINSPEVLRKNETILEDVAKNAIVLFYVILQDFLQKKSPEGILSIRDVHYLYKELAKYQANIDMLDKAINLLPDFLRQRIRNIVGKNNQIMAEFSRGLGKVLAICSAGYSKRYRALVDESLYSNVWSLEVGAGTDFTMINQRYLGILQAEMKKKMETVDSLFDPLKTLQVFSFQSFDMYKQYYLNQIARRFKRIMAFTEGGNLATPQQFIKYSEADMDINNYYPRFSMLVNNVVQTMLLQHKDSRISANALKMPSSKEEAPGPLVTRDEIAEQDRRIAKMQEAARRQKAQEEAVLQEHLNTKRREEALEEAKIQGEKAKVRAEIIAGMQKLTKDEALLLEKILQNTNPKSSKDVSLIKAIFPKLNLNPRDTQSSGGGQIVIVYKTPVNFHPKHHGHKKVKGQLDDAFIADFRKALNELGITHADLLLARKSANAAAGPAANAAAAAAHSAVATTKAAAAAPISK